jgi:peptidoglycan/LPS O-acetylase OafA/YrhL
LVIVYHCHELRGGWLGVDLFFVLSGYLITGILLEAKEAPHYFRNFMGRRALRIFPPYFAYLIVILIVLPRMGLAPGPHEAWWVWGYLTNVRTALVGDWSAVPWYSLHLWSVAVEEQFYLVWPLIVWLLPAKMLRRLCLGAIVVALTFRLVLFKAGANYYALYDLTPSRMDALMVGAWLVVSGARPSRAMTLAGVAVLGAFLLVGVHDDWPITLTVGFTAVALAAGVVVSGVPHDAFLARALSWKPLRLAGRYSYTAYLIHPLVIDQMRAGGLYTRRFALLVIIVTFAIAAVSWKVFESPILSLKRFLPEPLIALEPREAPSGPGESGWRSSASSMSDQNKGDSMRLPEGP